ncbi:IS66 family insertion sequence element accessory protein TnpB, partial [Falsiroseomonas sp. HW251]|uniref:IS66 family insertion sequence element accessory protein TnpB n=1 Tax=Falsiroseomonas sp. HW251 TaxID=3390998 RepID=UPI003D310B62
MGKFLMDYICQPSTVAGIIGLVALAVGWHFSQGVEAQIVSGIGALLVAALIAWNRSFWRLAVRFSRPQEVVKCLCNDGVGLCLLTKRIEQGAFPWPTTPTGKVVPSPAQMSLLLRQ